MNAMTQHEIPISQGPIKRLFIKLVNNEVTAITMVADPNVEIVNAKGELLRDITQQLVSYASHAHNDWTFNLAVQGTPFQQKVWRYLQTIPLGETKSYGQVAEALSSSARAVGNACRANPYLLVIPCHRVTSKKGLGGFAGQNDGKAIAIKKWLLEHERS